MASSEAHWGGETSGPGIDATMVLGVLARHGVGAVTDLTPLTGGFFSRAFAFVADGQPLVVRLNTAPFAEEGFAKDEHAWRHFASPALPIPRIVARGRDGAHWFAISERVPGRTLADLPPEERRVLLPATLDTLDAILGAPLRGSRGYGDWDADGQGRYARWADYLARVIEDEPEGYYAGWHALFRQSFLERDLYEAVYRRMLALLARCPEERALLHNDYWFENVLADGDRISGVIDWANALYGDPLYDVARLAWGAELPGWWFEGGAAAVHARYGALPDYAVRLACCQCHIALDDLRFYAKNDKRAEYDWARGRLLALLADGPTGA